MRIFKLYSHNALVWVYDTYLSNPLSDHTAPRGPFIDRHGNYRSYPHGKTVQKELFEVYRPNHGLVHNVRVTSKVRDVIALYADINTNKNPKSRSWFEQANSSEEITKLEVVSAFYVACRESEAGFKPEANSHYQRYRHASSEAFYSYASQLKKEDGSPLFSEDELNLYKMVLQDPYFDKSIDGPALSNEDDYLAKKAAAKAILSSCHALDLARCFRAEKMNHKLEEVLDPLGIVDENADAKKKVAENFLRSEIQHILTGNKCNCIFNSISCTFSATEIKEKRHLFQLASTNPDIAIRLVALSHFIETPEKAKEWAILLNRYAMKGKSTLDDFLNKIEASFSATPLQNSNTLLLEEKALLKNTSKGRIFKTVRNDSGDFWDDFVKSLVDPENVRPGIGGYKDLRNGTRKAFTIRLNKGQYEIISTDKKKRPSLHGTKKKEHTKHQSTSYSNYEAGYNPPFFGHNTKRSDLLVGVSFDPEDCIIQRILTYDSGTVGRPYDFDTEAEARIFLEKKIQEGIWHLSLGDLQEQALEKNENKHNEIMAGFQWTTRSSITVFSDNIESRLLAMLRAQDLKNRLEAKNPGVTVTVPITIYPEFTVYSKEQQEEDIKKAEHNPLLKKYIVAIQLLSNTTSSAESMSIKAICDAYSNIKKVNPDFCIKLNNYANAAIIKDVDLFKKMLFEHPLSFNWISPLKLRELKELAEKYKNGVSEVSLISTTDIAELENISTLLKLAEPLNPEKNFSDRIDSLEKLKCYLLLCEESKRSTLIDTKGIFLALINTDADILYISTLPYLEQFQAELIVLFKQKEISLQSFGAIIAETDKDKVPLFLIAGKENIPDIKDLYAILHQHLEKYPWKYGSINEHDQYLDRIRRPIIEKIYADFKDLVKNTSDFIQIHCDLSDAKKIDMTLYFLKIMPDWIHSVDDFDVLMRHINKDKAFSHSLFLLIKDKMPSLIGSSTKNLEKIFQHLDPEDRETTWKLLSPTWIQENIVSAESFCEVALYLNANQLKIVLDSPQFDKKTILNLFSRLRHGFNSLPNDPEIIGLIISHEKTKALIERSWSYSGDFIDAMYNKPDCLNIGLESNYYKTPDGIRALPGLAH